MTGRLRSFSIEIQMSQRFNIKWVRRECIRLGSGSFSVFMRIWDSTSRHSSSVFRCRSTVTDHTLFVLDRREKRILLWIHQGRHGFLNGSTETRDQAHRQHTVDCHETLMWVTRCLPKCF
ncbi:uncharacterized protein LOC112680979 isoform X2 [Sipha flava]|uniref:Uncharacterized protein LOC112680979 isoform X2 n=1 Tax=Sipha flava TaxID=143950 RepID=A0A8B8F9H0_9HEMI|nr:uncharacterized protein LOC112680979 isoform X2 [Sipha flava]